MLCLLKNKKVLTFRIYFCFVSGCSSELEKDLLKGSGIFCSVCIYCRKLGPFWMSMGTNQRTKDVFPSAVLEPCTQHPDPRACFFSGPHASIAQTVLNLSSYYIFMLPLHLPPM